MRKFCPLGVVLLACLTLVAAKGRDAFDGTWKVTVTQEDGKTYEDTLTFAKGKFVSESCKAHGFAETAYDLDARAGATGAATFTATATSAKEGKAKWTGTATGPSISGSFTWTMTDGSTKEHTFKGERADK
jgi:hypothetical protein